MADYIKVPLQRMYLGHILDVRDYVWNRARRLGFGLAFMVDDQIYKIEPSQLEDGILDEKVYKSKLRHTTHKEYRLVLFSKPREKNQDESLQSSLF